MTADPASFGPGAAVTFTVTIRAAGARVGGLYIPQPVGTLNLVSGEGLKLNQGLTHERPKAAEGGAIVFRFGWQAPAAPGAVAFEVYAVAGNGNNATTGDAPGAHTFQWLFGCTGRQVFWDADHDGFGTVDVEARLACSNAPVPAGYAARADDCSDFDENVHPGAEEICNLKDDNCDGTVDENAPPVMLWPDADGDGYYASRDGTPRTGCGGMPGYAAIGGDCAPNDPTISPGAKEVCNLKDDDCDGRIDELVRPRCGIGWCAREAISCNAADCVPGTPLPEACNLVDDDCDGEIDEEAPCGGGLVCFKGACVADSGGSVVDAGNGGTGGHPAGSGGATTTGPADASSASGGAGGGKGPPVVGSNNDPGGCGSAGCSVAEADASRIAPAAIAPAASVSLLCGLLAVARRRRRRAR